MEQQLTEVLLDPINIINAKSNLQIILFDPEKQSRAVHDFNFEEVRVKPNSIAVGINNSVTVSNFVSAVNLDLPNLFKAELLPSSGVKIKLLNPNLVIGSISSFNPILAQPIFDSQIVVTPINPFKVNSIQFLTADIASCAQVKVKVATNQAMTSYCRGFFCNQVNSSVVEFVALRGVSIIFKAIKGSDTITRNINVPNLLSEPIVNIIGTPFGASVSVIVPNSNGLDLQYSLDNINWQLDNIFSGLDVGNHTLFVKDQLGCSKSKQFTVLENSFGYKPYVFVSKENSFRFKEPNSEYRTDENQFFNQSTNTINYCFIQDFLNSDIIKIQFKSNYQNVSVDVRDLDLNIETQIPVVKQTNNLAVKQKLSNVKKYKINNEQFGVYFESGNILNYDTNIPIESYSLNGSLPIWAKLGNFISINGAFYQINAIGFDEVVNAEVLIFNGFMSVPNEVVVASSIYNLQDYEVYEFEINFLDFSNSRIQIEIRNSDPNYGDYNWTSEEIHTHENLNKYLEIRYFNSTNTNVIYSTGIEHLLRIPFNKIKAVDSDTNENYNTDTNTYLLDSKIYEITEFDFMPLPLELWRKLKIALSVDTIFIDGVGYSKNAEFTKEALGSTNLYKVTAQMIKNGFTFSSSIQSNEILIENPTINIPGLIENNSAGFIQY